MYFEKFAKRYSTGLYVAFRILLGLLFAQHGAQKLLGFFGGLGGETAALFSLMWFAGIIELVGGLAIAVGLFTRLAGLIAGVEVLIAYFMVHAGNGLAPIVNKGELALLYFAAFLIVFAYGAKKFSLDKVLFKKEIF